MRSATQRRKGLFKPDASLSFGNLQLSIPIKEEPGSLEGQVAGYFLRFRPASWDWLYLCEACELLHRSEVFTSDHAERQGIDHSDRTETGSTVHTTRDFATSKEAFDRLLGRGRDHFSLFVDHHTTHRVVDLRRDFDAIERSLGNVKTVVELEDAVEVRIFARLHETVELLYFSKEGILLDTEVVSEFFEGVELLNRTHFERELHEGRVDGLDNGVIANGDRVVFICANDLEEGVRLDLTTSMFVHEALTGLTVNHNTQVHASVVREVHRHAKALFTRVAIRKIDANGKPIPGFWAAGETTGGIFGRGRPGGMSLITCLVQGRDAGRAAAQRMKDLR